MSSPPTPLVLFVDRDAAFTGWAVELLRLCGVASHVATDLAEAEAFVRQQHASCLILAADGNPAVFRFGQAMTRDRRHPLPVAYVTAQEIDDGALFAAHYYGGLYLLHKPVAASQLLSWVGSLLLIERQMHSQFSQIELLEQQAGTDPLTGLCNRRLLFRRLDEELARAARYGGPVSLIYLDIDHFKNVNDTHGHNAGDEVLRQVAQIIGGTLRKSDTVGRIGGEEFVILLPATAAEPALMIAERLRERVARHEFHIAGGAILAATLSAGVCSCLDAKGITPDALTELADKALYEAKQQGRNRVVSAFAQAAGS